MSRLLYSSLFRLALPLLFGRLLWRARRAPGYRERWGERLAWYGPADGLPAAQTARPCVILHAVSVGEVHAAAALLRRLRERRPDLRLVLTTTTPTGSARVRALFPELEHVYLPYDLPGAVRRFLGRFRPDLLVLMETELWPNLIHEAKAAGSRVLLANARLSEKSRRSYARFPHLTADMLGELDAVAVQSSADGARLQALGLPAERLHLSGSMKFDLEPPATQIEAGRALRERLAPGRPVWIAASTREGEDAKVLEAFLALRARHPRLLLVLVPRHPERFDEAVQRAQALDLRVLRRSELDVDAGPSVSDVKHKEAGEESESGARQAAMGQAAAQSSEPAPATAAAAEGRAITPSAEAAPPAGEPDLLLGDSMGELFLYYGMADLAFVGGSLVDTGCQNILEPAALGLPVLTGPSLFNFQDVSERLLAAGAMRVVRDAADLACQAGELLDDAGARREMAEAALRVTQENRGATERTLGLIEGLLGATGPQL